MQLTLERPVEGASARLPRLLPGIIYAERETGELLGVVSCDSRHFIEVMRVDGFVCEKHVKDIHGGYELVHKTGLRAVRETLSDHAGEFAVFYVLFSVSRGELFSCLRAVGGRLKNERSVLGVRT